MPDLTDEEFERLLDGAIQDADDAFHGKYKKEIEGLLGLSREEVDAVTPGNATDLETYEKLMAVVREASSKNASQAALISRVKALGEVAISIAGKVPSLAALL